MALVSKASLKAWRSAVAKLAMAALLTRMSRRPWVVLMVDAAESMVASSWRSRWRNSMVPGRLADSRSCSADVPRWVERAPRRTW